jgi:predicted kinase
MLLLVLYGPPAAGKLTVATHLAEKTEFKLFHNHVSIDVAKQFFERGSRGFNAITHGMRKLVFEEAAKANLNLIFTVVYAHPIDNEDMRWMTRTIETWGGKVKFVQLVAGKEQLRERIDAPSRKPYGKIVDRELLEHILEKWDVFTPYPDCEHPSFDTSLQSPDETAEQIIQHFNLTTVGLKSS